MTSCYKIKMQRTDDFVFFRFGIKGKIDLTVEVKVIVVNVLLIKLYSQYFAEKSNKLH